MSGILSLMRKPRCLSLMRKPRWVWCLLGKVPCPVCWRREIISCFKNEAGQKTHSLLAHLVEHKTRAREGREELAVDYPFK